jgi:hypothetical protein
MTDSTSKTVYFQGPVMWAKVFGFNRDKGEYAPEGGQYTISIGLDKKAEKTVKSWNRLYTGKVEDDGLTYFQFKRKHTHLTKDGDPIEPWSGPPVVVDAEGHGWDENTLIGNGSVCSVKLNITTMGNKTFVRLEGVRVDELVAYEGSSTPKEPTEVENHSGGLPF